MRAIKTALLGTTLFVLSLFAFMEVGWAHGEAAVSVYPQTVSPGETIFVQGEDINPNGAIALFLEGLKGKFRLGQVQGDEDGGFKTNVAIPPEIALGSYLLKAVGANGTSVTFEIVLTGDNSAVTREPRQATDEPIPLEREKSAGDWAAIGVVLALGVALGGWLIRPERQ